VQRHAHPQRPDTRTPGFREQCLLGFDRGRECSRCVREGDLRPVADNLEEDAVMSLDRRAQQGEVSRDGLRHRRPVPLPERSTAFDVGEEEGNGATGKVDHRPTPDVSRKMRLL
jgi:hypothetical protein